MISNDLVKRAKRLHKHGRVGKLRSVRKIGVARPYLSQVSSVEWHWRDRLTQVMQSQDEGVWMYVCMCMYVCMYVCVCVCIMYILKYINIHKFYLLYINIIYIKYTYIYLATWDGGQINMKQGHPMVKVLSRPEQVGIFQILPWQRVMVGNLRPPKSHMLQL